MYPMYPDFEQSPYKGSKYANDVQCREIFFECATPGELSEIQPKPCSRDRAYLTRRGKGF